MTVKLLTDNHLEFLSLKRGCTGFSESTLVKIPHCWKSHVTAQIGLLWDKRVHKWINSWLSGRTQHVVLGGQAIDPVRVLSGVPQRSVLGPILFLIFTNDLPDNIRSSVRLFADDYVPYKNIY